MVLSTIESILTNEKYMGDARLQKKFTVDFLNKKMKVNEGEVPQYYVTDSHPAIISKKEWDQVQEEMKIRKSKGKHHNSLSPFSEKIICGDCGEYYGSKVWHSTDKYKRTIWQCNGKYKGDKKCETPHITEDELKQLFLEALATLLENRDQVLDDCRTMADYLSDTSAIDEEIEQITDELDMLSAKATRLIEENASTVIDQEEYNRKYDACAHRFSKVQERLDYLKGRKVTLAFEADVIECYAAAIYNLSDFPVDFSDKLFHDFIDHITIYRNDRIVFTFKGKRDIEKLL